MSNSHLKDKMNSDALYELKESQTKFIQEEVWMLTYGASFQRAYAYVKDASEKTKGHFKVMTSGYIDDMLSQYRDGSVSEEEHVENIKRVSEYSANFSEIFIGGRINFGIAQKMVNLYLKYQWCLGNIAEPPHFPVDRIIQEKLIKSARKNKIAPIQLKPWTQFKDESHYLKVINLAREVAKVDWYAENLTPAQAELKLFERR